VSKLTSGVSTRFSLHTKPQKPSPAVSNIARTTGRSANQSSPHPR
jgi:hypothetical protein